MTCTPGTPLRAALAEMQRRRIGSMIVAAADGAVEGILTRHDVLGRVTLPGVPLDRIVGFGALGLAHLHDDVPGPQPGELGGGVDHDLGDGRAPGGGTRIQLEFDPGEPPERPEAADDTTIAG